MIYFVKDNSGNFLVDGNCNFFIDYLPVRNPLDIPDCSLWLDASSGITTNYSMEYGDVVLTWQDISPSNLLFTATSIYVPRYNYKQINNLPTVTFESNRTTYLKTTNNVPITGQTTIFLVYSQDTDDGGCLFYTDGGQKQIYCGSPMFKIIGDTHSEIYYSSITWPKTIITSIIYDTPCEIYENGILQTPVISASTWYQSNGLLYIGSALGIANYSNASIAEVIMYSRRLSITDLNDVNNYLKNKYNL